MTEPHAIRVRDLRTIEDFRRVVELEHEIWGYTDAADTVTVPVLIITAKRGAILLGAFDADERMVGFVFSLVGLKGTQPTQWSHMLGVVSSARTRGTGQRLKLEQRERALAAGFDLIEWTFDPLQAANAHLNFAKLGVLSEEYARNFYGPSTSVLHRGTATDRLVVQWHIREPHVERRVSRGNEPTVRSAEVGAAPVVNSTKREQRWLACGSVDLTLEAPRLWVEIPVGFTEMQAAAPELASEWRTRSGEMFEQYFARGYRAVDFVLDREGGRGRYLLARTGS